MYIVQYILCVGCHVTRHKRSQAGMQLLSIVVSDVIGHTIWCDHLVLLGALIGSCMWVG